MAARHSAPISCTATASAEADDQAGEHRAGHAADAAEDRGGKQRQQQVESHLRADLHQQPGADAGNAGKARAEQPDDADHLAHLDADDAGELRVLADGAHRAADRRARQKQMHGDDEHGGDAERQQLVGRRPHAAAERQRDLQAPGCNRPASR